MVQRNCTRYILVGFEAMCSSTETSLSPNDQLRNLESLVSDACDQDIRVLFFYVNANMQKCPDLNNLGNMMQVRCVCWRSEHNAGNAYESASFSAKNSGIVQGIKLLSPHTPHSPQSDLAGRFARQTAKA